jgi:hypothetical protein
MMDQSRPVSQIILIRMLQIFKIIPLWVWREKFMPGALATLVPV